ncbi:hypothetical protein BDL97_03G106500 [Sphagnum fallax]|nr:hypothetical protein BDL97_03G106500 [Sphagnum fallax]
MGSESDRQSVRLDISFELQPTPAFALLNCPEHALVMRRFGQVRELMGQFPPITLLALLLKQSLLIEALIILTARCVFDPRHMCVHIWAGGIYVSCDRGLSIDPLYIEDLFDFENNMGSTCFWIQQIVKAFADAHASLEKELFEGSLDGTKAGENFTLLQKILPSMAGK